MTKEPLSRPIPEQQRQLEAAKDRVRRACEFFETHFDVDGNPITKRGLFLHYKYYDPVYYPVKSLRVFKEGHREEPETCGTDHSQGPRTILTVEYVPPHSRGEGRDESSL